MNFCGMNCFDAVTKLFQSGSRGRKFMEYSDRASPTEIRCFIMSRINMDLLHSLLSARDWDSVASMLDEMPFPDFLSANRAAGEILKCFKEKIEVEL